MLDIILKNTSDNHLVNMHQDVKNLLDFFNTKRATSTEKEVEDKIRYSIQVVQYIQTVWGGAMTFDENR